LEQSPDEICALMGLTETQFRLLKSRVKARLDELAKRAFSRTRGSAPKPSMPVRQTKNAKPLVGRVLPVAAHAVAVFGDEQKAAHWFATPLPLLGGRSPEEVFNDKHGVETVDRILTRIEHNIPS
jgi:putative toxin-antitoxin system antitoxin component (TIGR02293 family)